MNNISYSPFKYALTYSTIKKPMNPALKEETKYAAGLNALLLLKKSLCPSSFDNLETLLDIYPESVIEFGAYEVNVGVIPNRNTLIWEVRNY